MLQKGSSSWMNRGPFLLSLSITNPKLQEHNEEAWLVLKPRRGPMLLSRLGSLKAWRGGSASGPCPSPGSERGVAAEYLSLGAAWAPVCLLCQHQSSYYMTKWDLHSGNISAGLTRQNGQHEKMPVPAPLLAGSQNASWPLHFLLRKPSLASFQVTRAF